MNDLIEEVAKTMAVGNNGGDWAKHYTEEQKSLWRARAEIVIQMVKEALVK